MAYSRQRKRPYHQNFKALETPAPPLGPYLQSLNREELKADSVAFQKTATIASCSLVASYNWLDGKTAKPTILVPGKPPRWTPMTKPTKLREDAGQYFRDKNAARYPKHPMEPAALVILDTVSALGAELDLVACGSTLGNLLRFVRGEDRSFRLLAEIVHDTVFFIRRENSPTELIPDVREYGHSFPEAYTSRDVDVKGSASHQRLIRYRFGGLNLLVRSEGDGYLSEGLPLLALKPQPQLGPASTLDSLIEGFSTSNVTPYGPTSHSKVEIKHAGEFISQSFIIDLKTRSARKKGQDTLGEELPRLWVTQIPKFILAYHEDGVFNDIEIRDVRAEIMSWEKAHSNELSILAALINQIIALVRSRPDGKSELRYAGLGNLEVRKQGAGAENALSPEVKSLWMRKADSDSNSTSSERGEVVWVETDEDYTACTESCGYCGRCTY